MTTATHLPVTTLSASSLIGNPVRNARGDDMGKVEDLMISLKTGVIAYAVVSFGGFLGMGEKYFAVPWGAMRLDTAHKEFVLPIAKDVLKEAPGFDKDEWPDFEDISWAAGVSAFYRTHANWQES